jgi:putative ABC transport system substrate-binding protein
VREAYRVRYQAHRSRRSFLGLGLVAGAAPLLTAWAPGPTPRGRARRIGFINGASFPTMTAAFKDELRALGWIEGENLVLEARLSRPNTNDVAAYATELAALEVELIVAASLPVALEVRRVAPSMPMVVATAAGLVSNGFAASLERPGGNVTGMDELPPGLTGKRLQLLKEAAPKVSRVALLSTTPGRGGHEAQLADAEAAAGNLGVTVKPYPARSLAEVEAALGAMVADGMNGLVNFQGALSLVNRELIVGFATGHRMPAIYQSRLFVNAGGLMSYAPDQDEQFRNAARYADKILKGARPGDLPIQHPARYDLTINARTARQLGLSLPPSLLAQAKEVLQDGPPPL